MEQPRITINLPCYLRPQRTLRAIQCILDQDINNWEAFIMGDNCPHFQKLIDNGYLAKIQSEQKEKGNIIHYFNADKNYGGCGYHLTNYAIQNATGKYFVFLDNDDLILSNHLKHYLSEIENTNHVMVYYNSRLVPFDNSIRKTILQISCIGHCDIIVRTDVAKAVAPHDATYDHDINFIYEVIKRGTNKKALSREATYHVMRLGNGKVVDKIN